MGDIARHVVIVNPDLGACSSIERDNGVVLADDVHQVVDDDGIGAVAEAVIAGGIEPHLFQLCGVAPIDLLEGRVLRGIRSSEVTLPGGVGCALLSIGGTSRFVSS